MKQAGTYLTHLSGNYLDWFNIGGLARQRTREAFSGLWTHYSWRELFIRGGMIISTVLLAIYGGQPGHSADNFSLTGALQYGAIGFFVTHSIAMVPTIARRYKIVQETNQQFAEFLTKLEPLKQVDSELAELIFNKTSLLQQGHFTALKRGDAAINLTKKKCLMRAINLEIDKIIEHKTDNLEEFYDFWKQSIQILITELLQNTALPDESKLISTNHFKI